MATKPVAPRTPTAPRTQPNVVELRYQLIRNTTSPDEATTGVKSFVVNLPVFEILNVDTRDNLRSYLAEYNPAKRNRVHEAIEDTILITPERFITRNSGFVIAAESIEIDDAKKTISLVKPSILNGAQSQGEIKRWVKETYAGEIPLATEEPPFYVRAEIIIDADSDEVVETAIARNTATPVKSISQAGARGHLDELGASIRAIHPELKIRMKETDEGIDTRKILQFARLLMPASVSGNESAAEQLRSYKNPEQCLTDFSRWYEEKNTNPQSKAKYNFMVQMAPHALDEYAYWEKHEKWNGNRIFTETKKGGRACRRDKAGLINWVSPGLVFPILGAMREFVVQTAPGKWAIKKPALFKPAEMISRALDQFRALNSDPMQMGRNAGAYDALRIYPATIVEVMTAMKEGLVDTDAK